MTSCLTAASLAAALVVGVFSQSHAAIDEAVLASATEPCPGHMAVPSEAVNESDCLTLCDAADMDHLLGVLTERSGVQEMTTFVVVYDVSSANERTNGPVAAPAYIRGPPDDDLYLITRRLRL